MEYDFQKADECFNYGQYSAACNHLENALSIDTTFENKIILKSNFFISRYLSLNEDFRESEALSIVSTLAGITNEAKRKKAITIFCQNACLISISQQQYERAFRFIDIAQQNDLTSKSIKMYDSMCIAFAPDRFGEHKSSFAMLWTAHLENNHKNVLQYVGPFMKNIYGPYLSACANLGLGNYQIAQNQFAESVKRKFRIAESLNGKGICHFKLKQIGDSVKSFEQSMRMSAVLSPSSIYNCAEVCSFLGRTTEQQSLLELYARMEIATSKSGSISTLYKLSQLSLKKNEYETAVSQYQYVLDRCLEMGLPPPSDEFLVEFAFALNMAGDFRRALEILPPEAARSQRARAVVGHSLFLSGEFSKSARIIAGINTADSLANSAILAFISKENRVAFDAIERARKLAPKDIRVIRTATLIRFGRQQTIKTGCVLWLTALGYQNHHNPEFYTDLINRFSLNGSHDPVTIAALTYMAGQKKNMR